MRLFRVNANLMFSLYPLVELNQSEVGGRQQLRVTLSNVAGIDDIKRIMDALHWA